MIESINSSILTNALNSLQTQNSSTNASSKSSSKNEIINDLKQDGMSNSMSVQEIADKYAISLAEAQEIYDELHESNNTVSDMEYVIDNPLPDGSTVSYHV